MFRQFYVVVVMYFVVRRPAQADQVPQAIRILRVLIHRVDMMDYFRRYALAVALRKLTHIAVAPHDCVG